MLYEIHMLKNYPATNLNRDDTGTPKTCLFGGVNRSRISSQCLKRSWRMADLFRTAVGEENLGIRTRGLPQLVADALQEMDVSDEYIQAITPKISGFGNKEGTENKKDASKTAQIVFYAKQDIEAVAQVVKAQLDLCATVKAVGKLTAKNLQNAVDGAITRSIPVDVALFGRMVTSDAFTNVDASMQVAHAFSTNRVTMESDYYTAMDDLLGGDSMEESGAGMLGDVDFNSSCYYIYASIDSDALAKNLQFTEDGQALVAKVIPALLRTMALTNPSGKQNTFAGNVLPSAILVECREEKVAVSYANAFVRPITPTKDADMVQASIVALSKEATTMERNFALTPAKRLWFCVDTYAAEAPQNSTICQTLPEVIDQLTQTLE